MKAQCCICADLFENSADINIAAAPCGHTFHELCLMQWIEKSSTCPSCRIPIKQNKVIKRLYFDIREDYDGDEDNAELVNQNGSLKAQVKQMTKEKRDLAEERDGLAVALARCESEKDVSLTRAKDTEGRYALVKRELAAKEKLVVSYKQELRDFVDTQKRLEALQHINSLLKATEQECAVYTSCYSGGGEASVQQLSQMMGVIKREYDKTLSDKKSLREQVETLKAEGTSCKEELIRTKRVLKGLHNRAEKADQEVFALERKNNEKRRKIAHLRSALKYDKTEGSQSFIAAVTEDSPNVAYSPVTNPVSVRTDSVAQISDPLNDSVDLFEDNAREDTSNAHQTEKEQGDGSADSSTPVSKLKPFVSASDKFRSIKQAKIEHEKNEPPSCPFSKFSIMQKKLTGVSNWRQFGASQTRAFDGFGGSRRAGFDTPLGPSKAALLKFAPKKSVRKRSPLISKDHFNKPLPVDRLFKDVLSTKSSSSTTSSLKTVPTSLSSSSGSSTLAPEMVKVKKRSHSSQSEMIEKLAKSHKPVLAKSTTRNAHAVIDLTEDAENNAFS